MQMDLHADRQNEANSHFSKFCEHALKQEEEFFHAAQYNCYVIKIHLLYIKSNCKSECIHLLLQF